MAIELLGFIILSVIILFVFFTIRTYYFCRTNKENIDIIFNGIHWVIGQRNIVLENLVVFLNKVVFNHLDQTFETLARDIKNTGKLIQDDFLKLDVDKISSDEAHLREKMFKLFDKIYTIPNMEHNLDIHEFRKSLTDLNTDLLNLQDKYNEYVSYNNKLMVKFPYKYYNSYLDIFKLPKLKFKKIVEM